MEPITRRNRFRDSRGNAISPAGLVYAPLALVTAILRKGFGYRPEQPWLSYRALKKLDAILSKDSKVLEFGSGMSTIWLAKRVGFLHSIESNEGWHGHVSKLLAQRKMTHVKYELRGRDNYADVSAYPDGHFDFVLVDGLVRLECVRRALPKVKRGGWMYIDNIDADHHLPEGDMVVAEREVMKAIKERGGEYTRFVDFAPTQFFANQGLLARL